MGNSIPLQLAPSPDSVNEFTFDSLTTTRYIGLFMHQIDIIYNTNNEITGLDIGVNWKPYKHLLIDFNFSLNGYIGIVLKKEN